MHALFSNLRTNSPKKDEGIKKIKFSFLSDCRNGRKRCFIRAVIWKGSHNLSSQNIHIVSWWQNCGPVFWYVTWSIVSVPKVNHNYCQTFHCTFTLATIQRYLAFWALWEFSMWVFFVLLNERWTFNFSFFLHNGRPHIDRIWLDS